MSELWAALKSYLYGIGWLVISIQLSLLGFRLFDKMTPIDLRKEIENQNMACAIMVGLLLLGLVFGTLYFAAHVA